MLRCGPAGAAGKSSGASELPHGHPWCFHKPCSDLPAKKRFGIIDLRV